MFLFHWKHPGCAERNAVSSKYIFHHSSDQWMALALGDITYGNNNHLIIMSVIFWKLLKLVRLNVFLICQKGFETVINKQCICEHIELQDKVNKKLNTEHHSSKKNLSNAVVNFRLVRPRHLGPLQCHDQCSARSLTLNWAYKLTKGAGLIRLVCCKPMEDEDKIMNISKTCIIQLEG